MMRFALFALVAGIAAGLASCRSPVVGADDPGECSDVIASSEPYDEIYSSVRFCRPIEKVALYLASIGMAYPPSYSVGELIAGDGESLINAILLRLEVADRRRDSRTVLDLLLLLDEMASLESYDVAADRRTEAAFRSAVPRIRNEEIAEWSVELLGKLWGSQAMRQGVGPSDDDAPERFDFIP